MGLSKCQDQCGSHSKKQKRIWQILILECHLDCCLAVNRNPLFGSYPAHQYRSEYYVGQLVRRKQQPCDILVFTAKLDRPDACSQPVSLLVEIEKTMGQIEFTFLCSLHFLCLYLDVPVA